MKTAGVLGGMGPEATVDFMQRVIAATPAGLDQDHIRLLVDHNPTLPNRHDAIAGRSPSVGPQLADMARGLEDAGADFLVMVCNTAHAYADDIVQAVSIPFLNLITLTAAAAAQQGIQRAGLLAADGCLQADVYQTALAKHGVAPLILPLASQAELMKCIYKIKAGDQSSQVRDALAGLALELSDAGADGIIAACTEIPLVLGPHNCALPLLDSTAVLVQHTIQFAQGHSHASV